MDILFAGLFVGYLALAVILFFAVNWIGEHAVDFGYASTTLFEDTSESVALNFFLRALSPAVFIVLVAAVFVAINRPDWRLGIFWVAIDYYVLRVGAIFLFNRQRLVRWPKFVLHTTAGLVFAWLAYSYVILPNRSLLPNVEQMGNELWLAILAFLYAVANKVPVTSGPGAPRRNNFVRVHYEEARSRFGSIIDHRARDEPLRLVVYSVLIFEGYARPPGIRWLERLMVWKGTRTTGIMQVAAPKPLSDAASVERGTEHLAASWQVHSGEDLFDRVSKTIGEYNSDDDYIGKVLKVMEIVAKRADKSFLPAYEAIWAEPESDTEAAGTTAGVQ